MKPILTYTDVFENPRRLVVQQEMSAAELKQTLRDGLRSMITTIKQDEGTYIVKEIPDYTTRAKYLRFARQAGIPLAKEEVENSVPPKNMHK